MQAAMKVKRNLFYVLIVVCCSLLTIPSVFSEETRRDPQGDRRRCEQRCQRQQPYFEEHHCRQRCKSDGVGVVAAEEQDDAEIAYERCQQRCPGTGKEQWQWQKRCQDQYEAALEREGGRYPPHRRHHGDTGDRRPREHDYKRCVHDCERREEGFPRQRQCKLQCEEEFGHGGRHGHRGWEGGRSRRERDDNHRHKSTKKTESINPYYFDSQSFKSQYSTQEGHMRVLPRFAEKSELLLGIDKFRVGLYEANPHTFMLPHHWDADSVLFVIRGRATMTLLREENRETFDLERGDVLMIPAGTTTYLVNSHENERLQIAELLHPVNNPGHFEQYFGVGGQKPGSFFNAFSSEVLQAAFDVPREQLDKLFKQQKEGAIVKARREQVRALAGHGMSPRRVGEAREAFNLLNESPKFSNDHGRFLEVSSDEYPLLEDLDVSVTYCDIKQGSMMAPHYNSRATYIVMVEEGSGYIEMACPHIGNIQNNSREEGKHEQQEGSSIYKKVRSRLSKGDAFVIPAGHPVVIVASENENLRTVGFGINAYNNQMNFLAGQENIINLLDEEAKELSFNVPAREVEEMFQKQRNSYFMAGPRRGREQSQAQSALVSILDFAGFY